MAHDVTSPNSSYIQKGMRKISDCGIAGGQEISKHAQFFFN